MAEKQPRPGGFRLNIESTHGGPLVGPFPRAMCLTEDGKRAVPETSPEARVLLVGKGGSLTRQKAEQYDLMGELEEPKADEEKPAPKKAPAKKAAKKDEE